MAPPLPSATEIAELVDHARAGGLAVELRMRGDLSRMAPGVSLAVYRIAQEALANAARHSGDKHLHLALERRDKGLRVRVRDHGIGFDPEIRSGPGFGLISMRNRAEALGARLHIRSRQGRGTEVEFEL